MSSDKTILIFALSPVKPTPLTRPPVSPVNGAVSSSLHTAVGLSNAPPEEGPAGVAGDGAIVEMGGGGSIADGANCGETTLENIKTLFLINCQNLL